MVFLQPSATESAFIFSTDDGSDAILLDVKGVYALIDGGNEPLRFMDSVRTPSAAILSNASPSAVINAIELNKKTDSLVAVVGNLPSPNALKDGVAAEPIRELYKTLSVAPVVAQLKGSKPEPIVIHKGLSSGTLSVFTLAGDAKDAEAVAKAYQSGSSDSIEAAAAAASSVMLIVWQPVREDAPIKRILHLGCAPLPRIQQALDRARSLPFLQSASPSAASLKAKPPPSSAVRPPVRLSAAPTASKPAARVAPASRPAAPATRPAPAARTTPAAPAARPTSVRVSLPSRAVPPVAASSSSAARPARTTAAPRPAQSTARAGGRSTAGAPKEEVAKKTIVGKTAAASSSTRHSASSTPNGPSSRTPNKAPPHHPTSAIASPAAAAAVAAVAATTVVAASAVSPLVDQSAEEEQTTRAVAAPSIVVEEREEGGDTPGGLPVPASPTIIPATPQPPMSPEPEEEEEKEPVRDSSPVPVDGVHEEKEEEEEKQFLPSAPEEEEETAVAAVPSVPSSPSPLPSPTLPSAPLQPTVSLDEPQCVKELVEEDPSPSPTPAPVEPEMPHEEVQPVAPVEPEPEPLPAPAPTPVDPTPVGDLLGDFDTPVQPQQPGDDGLLDALEEPMKKMQISMDTDKLEEELGLKGGEKEKSGEGEGEESLLDLTQASIMDTDLDKTQNTSVIESAHEFDDLLSPRREETEADLQRKLSEQAEENLLSAAAAPFIAGLASTVVEAATIDGAKSTLESLISTRSVESPTGDKLLSFRSSGFENPDEPKEVKYEESDPAIDDVLSKLAEESEMVNGGLHHGELNGHGDSSGANGHHLVNGQGWPEGTTMHLPPPSSHSTTGASKGSSAREAKFKLAGPVHVDLVTVPHRGKQILLNDEATSLEFFSSVRSSTYILQSGGEVPVHVLDGWMKGKGQWAVNVPSRLIPTHHNDSIARWTQEHAEELAEVGLSVSTPVDLTTLTYPDGQAKACTIVL